MLTSTIIQNGQAFTFDAVSKNGSRPIVYSAIGSHANFAVPGLHTRSVGPVLVNDTTSAGPLWDPILSAYYYTYSPISSVNGTFVGSDAPTPVPWLYFLGRWGDEQYPNNDTRQVDFLNLNITWKYETGPTGPLDKDLNRTSVCPANSYSCTTLTSLPASSGSSVPVTVTRTTATSTSGSGTATGTATASATHKGGAKTVEVSPGMVLMGLVAAAIL